MNPGSKMETLPTNYVWSLSELWRSAGQKPYVAR